ncbi:protein DpdE [Duganella fentianensis]|uniref:protein DpdE n=1 Tax=Duganella fentianensis TaxID=2692177 RepID=UPI0032B2E3EE
MFCVVKGRERFGFGKLVAVGSECFVEYFDSPAEGGLEICQVPKVAIAPVKLGRNTRVYVSPELGSKWRVGRVQEDDGEGLYVRFSHNEESYVPYADAFVRWKRPINNPAQFLARFITETPQYAEARSGFMQNYTNQRGAAFGIQSLLSSSVELNPHQIDVARRILNDPSQRYLLADEVGLGKTIEAGIVIRQAVLDDPHHHIVILVPEALVIQWRHELAQRFGLRVYLGESVLVMPQEPGARQAQELERVTMLVVDEAHHAAAPTSDPNSRKMYEMLRCAARRAERLLLLSATPILRNEEGFLRMLHLLDPVVYPLEDLEGFRRKIAHRQALAEVVAMLAPNNALFLDDPLDDLAARVPDDERLQRMVSDLKIRLLDMPDEDDEDLIVGIQQLRAHISETYRLNRRILRNRRKQVTGLTPNRSGAQRSFVMDSPLSRLESALEAWRIAACVALGNDLAQQVQEVLSRFYWEFVLAYLENPRELSQLCATRRALPAWPKGQAYGRFEEEDVLLERIARVCDSERWLDLRCEKLIDFLRTLPNSGKVVVFCSNSEIADFVQQQIKRGHISVVRHMIELDDEDEIDKPESWTAFLSDPSINVLVCDRSAEEGLNLQGGNKTVIHFDLPIEPNRIEQRMGRVDRYGAGSQIRTLLLLDQGSPLQHAWADLLQEGLGIFNQSISSLQYLVEDELGKLRASLFAGGTEALHELTAQLRGPNGLVACEFKLIDQQDALDELSPVPETELDQLFEVDDDWRNIREAMLYWISDTLLFSAVPMNRNGAASGIEQPLRFHYHPPDSNSRATLIPMAGFLDDFLGAIDYEAPGSRAREPQSFPHMAHRTSAVKRSVQPLRYGDEFVEAIRAFSDLDDRGRSYAMWRQLDSGLAPNQFKMCFRFDFLIQARLEKAEAVLRSMRSKDSEAASAVLSRRGDTLLAPFIVRIWLDEEGDEIPTELVDEVLSMSYAKDGGAGYIDKNLGGEHFRALKRFAPDNFGNWHALCLRMHERARSLVLERPELAERKSAAILRARSEDEVRHAQWRSRIHSLTGMEAQSEIAQFELEQRLNSALYEGITNPELKSDVAGVVFLSDLPVSILDGLSGTEA